MRCSLLIVLLSVLTIGSGSLDAQLAPPRSWVLLATVQLEPGADQATAQVPVEKGRVSAIRLAITDGAAHMSRVVLTYGNGQQLFDDRPVVLKAGEQSAPIGEREEELFVDTVAAVFKPDPAFGKASFQVWGLQSAEALAAAKAGPNIPFRPRGKAEPVNAKGFTEIGIYYGTTRKRESDRKKNQRQLASFSGEEGKHLTLGRAVVTIPIEREVGSIPRPDFDLIVTRIAFRSEDPKRDFTIASVDVLNRAAFVEGLKRQAVAATAYPKQAFIFVHGYNVSFDEAIFRTAQIAHDIGFDGPAVTYSWPSRGGTWDYRHDVDTAKGARDSLHDLLSLVATDSKIEGVNVIAHSMGNDPLLEVLGKHGHIRHAGGTSENLKLREVVLAAPDISRNAFEQLARTLGGLANGFTLYASGKDRAMLASKRVASGLTRAGDVSAVEGPLIVAGVETIDVSDADTSFFSTNHSSFADRQHLVEDIRLLLKNGKHPPHERFPIFKTQGSGPKQFWRYFKN